MPNPDLNKDGVIDSAEAESYSKITEANLKSGRDKTQCYLAWIAMVSIIVITVLILTPLVDRSRLEALISVLETFYIVQVSVIGFYYGAKTYADSIKR